MCVRVCWWRVYFSLTHQQTAEDILVMNREAKIKRSALLHESDDEVEPADRWDAFTDVFL